MIALPEFVVNVGLDYHCANSIKDQAFTGTERGGLKLVLLGDTGDPKMILYCVFMKLFLKLMCMSYLVICYFICFASCTVPQLFLSPECFIRHN